MIIKVLYIRDSIIKRNKKSIENILDKRIKEEKSFYNNRFYVYKIKIDSIDKKINKYRFLAIDLRDSLIYYDGDYSDVKDILFEFFDIHHSNIEKISSVDDFYKLKSIKIVRKTKGQLSFSDNLNDEEIDLKRLDNLIINKDDVDKIKYEIIFNNNGAKFDKNVLKNIIENYRVGLETIVFKGFDKDENSIYLNSNINNKFEIFQGRSSWEDRKNINLDFFIRELTKIIR